MVRIYSIVIVFYKIYSIVIVFTEYIQCKQFRTSRRRIFSGVSIPESEEEEEKWKGHDRKLELGDFIFYKAFQRTS